MNFPLDKSVKYKLMSRQELIVNLNRLTRFKLPEDAYGRVFSSVILKYLIYPKYTKDDIEFLAPEFISEIVAEIWNKSVENIFGRAEFPDITYKVCKLLIDNTYKNIDGRTKIYINTKLNFSEILKSISTGQMPLNLKMPATANSKIKKTVFTYKDLIDLRIKYNLKFPLSKLIIAEGITEEILLPVFADKLGYNFDKCGIYILGAGGKSKSLNLYAMLRDKVKIPITLLFDADAGDINKILKTNLRTKDKSVIIQNGEFEDILSLNLIKRALNNEYDIAVPLTKKELYIYDRMCRNIENFYRTRRLGEFKKSKFSGIIAKNIKYKTDITCEIKNLFKLML